MREREREKEKEIECPFLAWFLLSAQFSRSVVLLDFPPGPRARLNGHRCPVWARNLLLAPLAPLAHLHPLLLAVLRCRCQ